ncbi:cobyrinate a,c-diamide synthase [Methylocapsa sp. S129]|uniref:cobyrinate a,c-diamide synthase n=1 Tax=Methylocapsa sp. S129 TaxID=1641869 RepID=UPI00131D55E6|nr:cobyrinate a,c-diamide synthase [Methylocapsa sp. S129]
MIPGLVIAAPRSGSGKTTLTLGLLRAYRRLGLDVVGVKSGPDYIDPAFHAAASGRDGLNLDSWAMPPSLILSLAARAAQGRALFLCEASMGLFDGVPAAPGRSGASADVAATLGAPILLVLDVSGQAQSAAAIVKGCAAYDPRIAIAGVILNRVGSARHRRLAGDAIEALGVPVVGSMPRLDDMTLPERHLGLVQAMETDDLEARLERIADAVAAHVDLAALRGLAQPLRLTNDGKTRALSPPGQRIAIARDAAFSFLYPHLLSSWRDAGAEIRFFSPLADEAPPMDSDFCWLPGGYPELHAGRIAAAENFLGGLQRFAEGRPVHGECGGYMILGAALTDATGAAHRMAGLLGVETSFAKRKMNLGYRDARLDVACGLGPAGRKFKGHEFHYSTLLTIGGDDCFAHVSDAYGAAPTPSGSRRGHVTGGFFHIIAEAQ